MAEKEEDSWNSLPAYDKVQHSNWKCRKAGYEALLKELPRLDAEKLKKYCPLVKGLVKEQNELSRMIAVEVAMIIVDNAISKDIARHCQPIMEGIISKCFNSKPKTKDVGTELCLQFVEHEKAEDVITSLLEGVKNKNPKVITASITALTLCLENFGPKIISPKPIFAELPPMFQHRDKTVRTATKDFFVEAHCWVGPSVKSILEKVPKIEQSIKECEESWKDKKSKSKQKRFLKSQVEQRQKAEEAAEGGEDEEEEDEEPEIDAFEFAPEIDVLTPLSKIRVGDEKSDFATAIQSKKWKDRGAALDELSKILGVGSDSMIKCAKADYSNLVQDLKTVVKKDTNVLLLIKAFKILTVLANALRDGFKNYGTLLITETLKRFKEKKATVVEAARVCVDAMALTIKFPDAIMEAVYEALEDKNPSIRSETCLFLLRSSQKKAIKYAKPVAKELMIRLIKNLEHNDKAVREPTYKIMALLSTKIDKKLFAVSIADLKDDRTKLLTEAIEALKGETKKPEDKVVEKPKEVVPTKKEPVKKPTGKKGVKKKAAEKSSQSATPTSGPPTESEITDDRALDQCIEIFGEEDIKKVQDSGWKVRLEGLKSVSQMLDQKFQEKSEIPTQAIFRLLSHKPGFKDTNFQCNQEKFKIITFAAANPRLSETSVNVVFDYCLDKIADVKSSKYCKEAISAMSDSLSLAFIASKILPASAKLKNVKNMAEVWAWFAEALPQFGFGKLDIEMFRDESKTALSHTNPAVRAKATESIATVMRYLPPLKDFYADQKDAIKVAIDDAFKKFGGEAPPKPIRGPVTTVATSEPTEADGDEVEDTEVDLMPRSDISAHFTEKLIAELGDKNWKTRRDALDVVKGLFEQNKYITAQLGDAPLAIATRLSDVNKVLVQTTIEILVLMAAALGKKYAKAHIKIVVVPMVTVCADSKVQIRDKAIGALSSWLELVPFKLWFDDEAISETLKDAKKVHLRACFLTWLAEKLPDQKKVPACGLVACLPHVYSCMEDRDGKVRDAAQKVLLGFMIHVGYPKMCKECKSPKIREELDKARELLPKVEVKAEVIDTDAIMKAASGSKGSSSKKVTKKETPKDDTPSDTADEEPAEKAPTQTKKKAMKKSKSKPAGVKKAKEEEEDLGEIITATAKAKIARAKDDHKLKTLKWTFPAGTAVRAELLEQLQKQIGDTFGGKFVVLFNKTDAPSLMKSISILEAQEVDMVINVLDVILRWMTVRLSEKNTTVLTKVLGWLQVLCKQLKGHGYRMEQFEALALLPHVIAKLGESREEVRNTVTDILRTMVFIFSDKRIFEQLLDGTKCKNSRQRTECLKHMGEMIASSGMDVLGPPKQQSLKDIATHISDKDQGVRSSAMNCLVEVHKFIGDEIYSQKKIGRLGEKEDSYLRERIKRAGSGEVAPPPEPKVDKRKSVTIARGEKAQKIKIARDLPEVLAEEPEPEMVPGRFSLKEPPPAETLINQMNLLPTDVDDILKDFQMPSLKHTDVLTKDIKKCLEELHCKIRSNSSMTDEMITDIITQLTNIDLGKVNNGLVMLNAIVDSDRPLDIKAHVGNVLIALSKLLTGRVFDWLNSGEEQEKGLTLLHTICNNINKIMQVEQYAQAVTVEAIQELLSSTLRLLNKKELKKWQLTIDQKLMPTLQKTILIVMKQPPQPEVTLGLIMLSRQIVKSEDGELVHKFIRAYYKFQKDLDKSSFKLDERSFDRIYESFNQFLIEYPRTHPIFKERNKIDILRCHVSFVKRLVRLNTVVVSNVIGTKERSALWECVRKELKTSSKSPDEKENEQASALRGELTRLVNQAATKETTKVGLTGIYEFRKKNPSFDVNIVFTTQNEYFRRYIEKHLEIIAKKEADGGEVDLSEEPESVADEHSATFYHDRLKVLKERLGIEAPLPSGPLTPVHNKEPESVEQLLSPTKNSPPKAAASRMNSARVEELKRRLNRLKQT